MKFSVVTLGCPKNEVDSEYYAHKLSNLGYKYVESPDDADFILLNTCAFIKDAISESFETYESLKKKHGKEKVIITGCLVERLKHDLGCAKFIRGDDIHRIDEALKDKYTPVFTKKQRFLYNGERICSMYMPYAYIKIQEGCSRRCTFCTIPGIRGKPRSRDIKSVVEEANRLAETGKKEIILVGEDLTLYKDLIPLLERLVKINDIKLIRLLYLHPQGLKNELLNFIKDNPKIARYLHIPIQHASNKVLKLMGRSGGERAVRKSIETVRKVLPGAFIRTEIMVGFPGESERDFDMLLNFLETYHIERIGIFKYSREAGTKSFSMPQVEDEVKEERFERASLLASLLMEKAQKRLHRKRVRVIADTKEVGRTEFDAPSSDFTVLFKKPVNAGTVSRKTLRLTEDLTLTVAT